MYFSFNSDQLLDVMAEFMGEDVSLGEFSRSSESLLEFVKKCQIDVDLLVFRAIERPAGCLSPATTRVDAIAEQRQLRVAIGDALLTQYLSPGLLRVVKDERDELHQRFFAFIESRIRLAVLDGGSPSPEAGEREKVPMEDQTQYQKNKKSADTDVNSPEAKSPTASA
jgi:hypothetical protein